MTFLQAHNRAFKTELLKLRHSGIFWLCTGAALFIPLVNTAVSFFINLTATAPGVNAWNKYIESNFVGFTSFFYPLFLVLMTVRLVYLEHRSDTWKLLETQPISKFALFIAKWEAAALISLLCLLGLFFFTLIGGIVLTAAKWNYDFSAGGINWSATLLVILRFWIAGLAIISVQYLFALIVKSFALPMGIGLMAVIAGSIFTGFGVLSWFPYSATALTSFAYKGSAAGRLLLQHEQLSILWTMFLLWAGYQYFVRKTVRQAFFYPLKRSFLFVAMIVAFSTLAWMISRPAVLSAYNKTVLNGHITSATSVSHVVLLRASALDTLMTIPIINGKFHGTTTALLKPGIYYLRAGNYRGELFFSTNDSLFLEVAVKDNGIDEKVTGTRIAENEYLRGNRRVSWWRLTNNAYNLKPAAYGLAVSEEWQKGLENLYSFKTVDNLKPRPDFVSQQRKLLAAKLMNLVDNYYPQVHAVYYPNDVLKYPRAIDRLRKELDISDSSMVTYTDFRNYVAGLLRTKTGRNDSLYVASLGGLKTGKMKDYVLFDAVQNDVFRIKDSSKRVQLVQQALASISDVSLKNILVHKMLRLQNLGRGRKAPNFSAVALNNAAFDLAKLSNRYVVLDVWATWCLPCKKEAPYFDELADKYTSEQLAFVSVSIDENKNAWRTEAAGNRAKVLQLWAMKAEEDFVQSFGVASIPRYLLIDPKGNIVIADLPRPSDPLFEATLQQEIAFLSNRIL
ncbi:MAG: ABC transporter permease [Chitinophagaceae bacterium]